MAATVSVAVVMVHAVISAVVVMHLAIIASSTTTAAAAVFFVAGIGRDGHSAKGKTCRQRHQGT